MTTLGSSLEFAIPYENDADIYTFLERTYNEPNQNNFYGITPDSYFVLTEQTLRDPKTSHDYRILFIEDKNGNRYKLFFKKTLT